MPLGHWGFLLQEAAWLANDMAQVRSPALVMLSYVPACGVLPPIRGWQAGNRRLHGDCRLAVEHTVTAHHPPPHPHPHSTAVPFAGAAVEAGGGHGSRL